VHAEAGKRDRRLGTEVRTTHALTVLLVVTFLGHDGGRLNTLGHIGQRVLELLTWQPLPPSYWNALVEQRIATYFRKRCAGIRAI